MKLLVLAALLSISAFADKGPKVLDKGVVTEKTTYDYVLVEDEVACVFAPNAEGEGPMYYFYKNTETYLLSRDYHVILPEGYNCYFDFGEDVKLPVVMIREWAKKAEILEDIKKAKGFRKVKMVFWKKKKAGNSVDQLKDLLK